MTERDKQACINFLLNEAQSNDLEHLEDWLKDSKNNQLFQSYIKTNYIMDSGMNSFDSEKSKQNYLKVIREEKRKAKRIKIYRRTGYVAAILVVALLIGNIVFNGLFDNSKDQIVPVIVNNNIKSGENKAILTLEDGSEVVFVKGASLKTANATSDGEEIVYNDDVNKKELMFNTLTIPRGGEFLVILSDGTKVWLNSETQLKYPVDFIEGQTRQVELVYGEAYFEVSPSIINGGSDFKVVNASQEIQVLGTKFNVRSYQNELNVLTTLVEGKVSVQSSNETKILKPNQQSVVNIENQNIEIKEADVRAETAWLKGEFIFKHKALKQIMRELSRWYDMDVSFENKDLEEMKFVGILSKDLSVEEILNTILNSGVINSYEINNKQVKIK